MTGNQRGGDLLTSYVWVPYNAHMTTLTQKLVGIPADHLRKLKAIAKRNNVKTSYLIRLAVKRYLDEVGYEKTER